MHKHSSASPLPFGGVTHVDKFRNYRKTAFTLAEVLITLGIIGVVAAMTMPTLIKKHQQRVLVTRLQKNYSIVSQALMLSVAENGDFSEWEWGTEYTNENVKRFANKYFVPYVKKLKMYEGSGTNSYHNYGVYLADGTLVTFDLDGGSASGQSPTSFSLIFDFSNDTEGHNSRWKDYSRKNFVMRIHSRKKFSFFAWGNGNQDWISKGQLPSRDELINHPQYGCNANIPKNKRYNCGALIQMDGWQIKDDYPW